MTSPIRLALTCVLAACVLLVAATSASAARNQLTILQDDPSLLDEDRRDATLDEWKSLGVDIVKLRLNWRDISPDERPADPSDPAAYKASEWARYDAAIRGAQERGMQVYIMLGGHAPRWASDPSPEGLPNGVVRPDPGLFEQFVKAAGTRYSGSYTARGPGYNDPNPLPRVVIWSVWNEPNLMQWLSPQRDAPEIYRNLLYAGSNGLQASGHGGDRLLYGELVPFGATRNKRRRPLEFLREVACVDKRYRAYRGSRARARGCDDFRPLPGTAVAHHPYTLAGGPRVKSSTHRDDAALDKLRRMTSTLDKLTRKKRFASRARQALWSTEFGYQTDPPDPVQSPIRKVPGYLGEAEYMAFTNSRVQAWSQYPFTDDPVARSGTNRHGGFQSGIKTENGRPKVGVYQAFKLPFFVDRRSSSRVRIFGGVRPAGEGARVAIESRVGRGKWRRIATVRTGPQGYFLRNFRRSGAAKRSYRFRWEDERSRTARPA